MCWNSPLEHSAGCGEGREEESSTADKVDLGECWRWINTAEMYFHTAYQLYLKSHLVPNKGKVPNPEITSWLYLKTTQGSTKAADESSMIAGAEKANISTGSILPVLGLTWFWQQEQDSKKTGKLYLHSSVT